ncbi:MAG: putative peptidyl-prolyl cis-trans isomerase [Bacteroidia bacterium]|nr:putative peptidyl-prolyl cis-trans isomerase [Bacteroidia bacterium]
MLRNILSILTTLLVFSCAFAQNQNETVIIISTSYGEIKIKLYNETPIHRDNFIKLIKEGKYNQSSFHRIINTHLIQGGEMAGENEMKKLQPEIISGKFHKRGALAAVREDDVANPEKLSSPTQFFIVLGNTIAYDLIDRVGERMNYKFTEEQKQAYSTIGGIPTLDGANTVFGEVIEGLDIVEKIASAPVQGETPLQKIVLQMSIEQH